MRDGVLNAAQSIYARGMCSEGLHQTRGAPHRDRRRCCGCYVIIDRAEDGLASQRRRTCVPYHRMMANGTDKRQ